MESRNRNVWIVIVLALLAACCCALAFAGAAAVMLTAKSVDLASFDLGGLYQERTVQTFEVGQAPTLDITNFAGSVTVRSGESGVVDVVAVKRASSRSKLDRIQVTMTQQGDHVLIRAKTTPGIGNASVALEITAPADASLDLDTGAGTVDVRDITGRIDVHTGAGEIDVRGAQGNVQISAGAGNVTYEGAPAGACRFQTGAGNILLRLPADPDVVVDLGTGIGTVSASYPVDGRVSMREVRGTIGDGSEGSIYAHTGAGNVTLTRR
jgi:DUF4097 and DUF4098 domain-containing protein YvlB